MYCHFQYKHLSVGNMKHGQNDVGKSIFLCNCEWYWPNQSKALYGQYCFNYIDRFLFNLRDGQCSDRDENSIIRKIPLVF